MENVTSPDPEVIVNVSSLPPFPSIVELNKISLLVATKVADTLNVTAPVYVCVDVVVTSAPRLEVEDTDSDVALVMAAFKSKIPVILIAPKVLVPPIIPSTCNSVAVTVKLFVSLQYLS